MLNGQVKWEVGVSLEHVVEEGGTEVSKIPCVKVVLEGGGVGEEQRERRE